jgi:hypothetical protein
VASGDNKLSDESMDIAVLAFTNREQNTHHDHEDRETTVAAGLVGEQLVAGRCGS